MKYDLLEYLGTGCTGIVFKIKHDGRYVAVKVLFNDYTLEDTYKKLHSYTYSSDIFIKPYNFYYFDKDPIIYDDENDLKSLGVLNLENFTNDIHSAEYLVYFMELLIPINLKLSTREKYILFIYKFIEQCKLLDVFDSDGFGAIMMRPNGDFVFYDLDRVYFGNIEGRDSTLNNLINISGYPHYFPQYVYFDSRNIFDYEIHKRFMELYNDDLIKSDIILEERVYSVDELIKIINDVEESGNLTNGKLQDFLYHMGY